MQEHAVYKLNNMEWREFEEDYAKEELKLTDEQIKKLLKENYYVENKYIK